MSGTRTIAAKEDAYLPPGPAESPEEQARAWMNDPCGLLESCQSRFGDLFTLRLGAFGTIVIVADPKGVKQIFAGKSGDFECRQFNASYRYAMGDHALFLQDGANHARLKHILAPAFHPARLEHHAETVRKVVSRTITQWSADSTLRLRPAMHEITLACLLALSFGENSARSDEILSWFRESVWTDLRSWKPWTGMSRLRPRILAAISSELDRLSAAPTRGATPVLLEHLLQARDPQGLPLEREEILDQITMLMITAGDAVAVGSSWALYRAARHQDVQERLRAERKSFDAGQPASKLLRRPYLSAMLRELLRLHPVLPTVSGRHLTAPSTFLGYNLPAGITLAPCQYLVHRQDGIFAAPLAFRPERFLEQTFPPYCYFPFGGGQRACLGSWLAPLTIAVVLDTILSYFELKPENDDLPDVVRQGTLLAPDQNLSICIKPLAH